MAEIVMNKYNSLKTLEEKRTFFNECSADELAILTTNPTVLKELFNI